MSYFQVSFSVLSFLLKSQKQFVNVKIFSAIFIEIMPNLLESIVILYFCLLMILNSFLLFNRFVHTLLGLCWLIPKIYFLFFLLYVCLFPSFFVLYCLSSSLSSFGRGI